MKISRLKVDGLFGLYDYDIDFSHNGEDFTVLTSPNGYGKTTLLCIINSLSVKRLFNLYSMKFKCLSFSFSDGSILTACEMDTDAVGIKESDTRKNQRRGLTFVWSINGNELCRFDYRPDNFRLAMLTAGRSLAMSRHYPGDAVEERPEYFLDGEGGEAFNTELACQQNQEQFFLQLATIQTDFIGANRIYSISRRERQGRMTRIDKPVLQVVYELSEMLSEKVASFQNNFQRLDSKLIDMLLEGKGQNISEEEYIKRSSALTVLMDELTSFGLTNKQTLPPYQTDNSKILDVYLNTMEEKLQYYKDLLPLIRLFNKNVQQKQFANKSIKLSPQHGLRIESVNGDILSADMLSTGEQNQVVLLYDLIFKTPKGSILLIDEPESSLHVAWQNDFVSDMRTISESKGLQIIVATHSSIIVNNTPGEEVFDLYYLQKA